MPSPDRDLDELSLQPRGATPPAWGALLLSLAAWPAYAYLAAREDLRSGLDGTEPFIRLLGPVIPWGLGFVAILLRRDHPPEIGQALRKDYVLTLAPAVGQLAALYFAFRALAGKFGGGTTVHSHGAHVEHHVEVEGASRADSLFGALLHLAAGAGMAVAYYYAFRALGVDLVTEIGGDFG